jgi:aspartyl protease family protein
MKRSSSRIWNFRLLLFLLTTLSFTPVLARDVVLLGVFPDRALVGIDGQRLVLVAGQGVQQGVGLLSTNTLDRRAWLEIDGQRRELAVVGRSAQATRDALPGVARIHPDASGALTVPGSIDGHAVRFQVDPGAALVLLSGSEAGRIGIATGQGQLTTVQTPAGRAFGHRVMLSRVQVGGVALDQVEAMVLQGEAPRLPVLGMSFLGRVQMREEDDVLLLQGPRP